MVARSSRDTVAAELPVWYQSSKAARRHQTHRADHPEQSPDHLRPCRRVGGLRVMLRRAVVAEYGGHQLPAAADAGFGEWP